ncbi:MAG TPA: cupin domain-containing protein [Pyrinomonadaceae bacterium]|nr:cupin domain-containing protein [Pyrinomonadaceae bacterium]
MAVVTIATIANENKTVSTHAEITSLLASHGIDYERWNPSHPVADDAPAEEILRAYSREIDELKQRGGYVTADVIDVDPNTAGLEAMLAKFNREHWHDEDEVRFTIAGHGLFHIHTTAGTVLAIEVEAGDLIRVPRGTLHWFNLCADRRIRAIRLFQDTAGWTPHYTDSHVDEGFLPVCFGLSHVPQSIAS